MKWGIKFYGMLTLCFSWAALAMAFAPPTHTNTFDDLSARLTQVNETLETFQIAKRPRGNNAGRGHKAKKKNYRPNKVTKGNNAGDGNYVGFPKANNKKYTERIEGN